MNPTLYFLRSSEQKIVSDMLHFAYSLDKFSKTIYDFKKLDCYHKHYGLTNKDLGLYALVDNEIAGAAWLRDLNDDKTALLTVAVKPKFREKGVALTMLGQLFLEAGTIYEQINVTVLNTQKKVKYFEKLGFVKLENSNTKSLVDDSEVITMTKAIQNIAIERPNDGYDPQKWMD
jgi:N-acetylglutamate synthase-like GNAT family acetyltransferase